MKLISRQKGGHLSKDYIKKAHTKPGGSNVGKKTFASGKPRTGPYVGPSGGAPKGSYPIPDIKHAKAALALAHNAPNPEGIKNAVYRKYPVLKHQQGGILNMFYKSYIPETEETPVPNFSFYQPKYNIEVPKEEIKIETPQQEETPQQKEDKLDKLNEILSRKNIKYRVTSSLRPGAKTKSGKTSYHSTGEAMDIVPEKGYTFNQLLSVFRDPEVMNYMVKNNLGVLDETSPMMMKKTGATGAHLHIGPDKIAKQFYIPKGQQGMVFKYFENQLQKPRYVPPIAKGVNIEKPKVQGLNTEQVRPITDYIKPENMERENYVETFYNPSENIKSFIKSTESFRPNVYKDSKGIPTIGYGFTDKKIIEEYKNKPMSIEVAEKIFEEELNKRVTSLKRYKWWNKLSPNQKDSLVSLHYNIGATKFNNSKELVNALDRGDWVTAARQMNHGINDKNNSGLKTRRLAEQKIFLNGYI